MLYTTYVRTREYYNMTLLQKLNKCARHARSPTTDIPSVLQNCNLAPNTRAPHEGQLLPPSPTNHSDVEEGIERRSKTDEDHRRSHKQI